MPTAGVGANTIEKSNAFNTRKMMPAAITTEMRFLVERNDRAGGVGFRTGNGLPQLEQNLAPSYVLCPQLVQNFN